MRAKVAEEGESEAKKREAERRRRGPERGGGPEEDR
jgi:hypothetical protein